MDDPRTKRLEQELDYAINQARMLRARLQAVVPQASGPRRKSRLQRVLDAIQNVTPEFFRALFRSFYLKHFYYRVFPENSPRAVLALPDPPPDPLLAHSGYPPFVEFKRQLCRDLSMDFRGVSVACEPGLVSVVLPVYNGEKFVAEAIESVLAQSYTAFELILVDDGSTDRTPEILAHYLEHPKVRRLRQENRKLPAALNAGFAEARGQFFTWISDDNRMHPGMLAELVGFLESHPDVEMVFADEELIDEHGAPALNSDFCQIYQSPANSYVLRRPRDSGERLRRLRLLDAHERIVPHCASGQTRHFVFLPSAPAIAHRARERTKDRGSRPIFHIGRSGTPQVFQGRLRHQVRGRSCLV